MPVPSEFLNSLTVLVSSYREEYRCNLLSELPDMTFRQFVYLDAIVRMHNPTYGEVAEKFRVSKPAVTAVVNKLIGLGYMERVQSYEDRRIYHLLVSEKGRRIMDIETKTATGYVESMKSCLSPEEQEQFISLVEKIAVNFRQGG